MWEPARAAPTATTPHHPFPAPFAGPISPVGPALVAGADEAFPAPFAGPISPRLLRYIVMYRTEGREEVNACTPIHVRFRPRRRSGAGSR